MANEEQREPGSINKTLGPQVGGKGGGWYGSKEHRDQGVKSGGDRKTLNVYFPDSV